LGAQKRSNTILFTGNAGSRVLNYSNPDVRVNKGPTGIEDERDNSRRIEELGCTTANLEQSEFSDLYGVIDGPKMACICTNVSLSVIALGGIPAYSYEWSYSYDGLIYTTINGNSSNMSIPLPCNTMPLPSNFSKGVYVKVKITDPYSHAFTAFKFIKSETEGPPCIFPLVILNDKTNSTYDNIHQSELFNEKESLNQLEFNIYPNPAIDEVTLEIYSSIEDLIDIRIIDLHGKEFQRNKVLCKRGENIVSQIINPLPNGLYLIQLNSTSTGCRIVNKIIFN